MTFDLPVLKGPEKRGGIFFLLSICDERYENQEEAKQGIIFFHLLTCWLSRLFDFTFPFSNAPLEMKHVLKTHSFHHYQSLSRASATFTIKEVSFVFIEG